MIVISIMYIKTKYIIRQYYNVSVTVVSSKNFFGSHDNGVVDERVESQV
jgi:hypothetical protein